MGLEENKAVVQRLFDAINNGRLEDGENFDREFPGRGRSPSEAIPRPYWPRAQSSIGLTGSRMRISGRSRSQHSSSPGSSMTRTMTPPRWPR